MTWPMVKLGEVLTQVDRREKVDLAKQYRLLGVRLEGAGPFLRETVSGTSTSAGSLSQVSAGDFIYSRLFAWRGAFGLISPALGGCYVSNEFPTFSAHADRLEARYLELWFRLKPTIAAVAEKCTGSTPLTRNRFKENFFLDLQIPLPPLAEQRRLVARIDALAAKIDEAKRLRAEASENVNRMLICMAHRQDWTDEQKVRAGWAQLDVGSVVALRPDPVKVDTTISYPNLGIYSFGRGLFEKPPIEGIATSATTLFRVRAGQFIYSRLFAFEGSYGIVPAEFDGRFVSNEYPTFDCDDTKVRPEFLEAYFKGPEVWQRVAVGSKGLGDRRQRVQPEQVLAHKFWLPPLWWQDRIAEARSKFVGVGPHRETIETELNALLPAILDRAFRGEL